MTTLINHPYENPGEFAAPESRPVRQRTLKTGIISYSDGAFTVECIVRDISAGGAKLKMVKDLPIPNRFLLTIPQDGLSAECEVRWRNGNQMGVAYVGSVEVAQNAQRQVVTPYHINQ